MDPISNVDRIVLLLQQKLKERDRTGRKTARERNSVSHSLRPSTIGALASIDGIDERQLRRTFIQTLLADQLGQELVNDAQFQQIVARVTDAIEEDEAASRLLSRVISDIRTAR